MQVPPQLVFCWYAQASAVWAVTIFGVHWPFVQSWFTEHVLLQDPQFFASELVSTQVEALHKVFPDRQVNGRRATGVFTASVEIPTGTSVVVTGVVEESGL